MKRTIVAIWLISYPALAQDRPNFAFQGVATRIECEKRPWIYPASRFALYGAASADLVSTYRLDGLTREENPILGQSPTRQIGIVVGLTAGLDLTTYWLRRSGHPRAATVINFLAAGAHAGAAGWNMHVLRRIR